MARILLSGLINIETTLQVDGFPIHYSPVNYPFFGINSTVSGVGYNIAKALTTLGDEVTFLSIIGHDLIAAQVRSALKADQINSGFVLESAAQTAQSVILYDLEGRRQIHVDLKNIQDLVYPMNMFEEAMPGCDLLVLANINFSRPFLKRARQSGKPIATDVHTLSSLEDEYNLDFMQAAHILFMSDEWLPTTPEDCVQQIFNRYPAEVVVIGLGSQGALLAVRGDNFVERFPVVYTRPVVNTIGAGDALFSAFVHVYAETGNPYMAIRKAILFASYKIGARSASEGFLNQTALERLFSEIRG